MNRRICTLLLIISISMVYADAWKANQKGIEKFGEENYEAALTEFRDAELDDAKSPIIAHNLGSTLYQQKRYDKSIEELSKALQDYETTDSTVLSQVYYNLGNNLFRQDSLLQSIQMYKKALEYNPEDEDAKYNLELARALLKDNSEKQQQNQQQQQQKQQQQQQQKQQNQDQDQEKEEEQQDQQQQQQEQQQKEQKEKEQQQQKQDKDEMSEEEAKKLLKALQDKEREQLKEKEKQRVPASGRSGKNW